MPKIKKSNTKKWLIMGLIAALIAAPNGLLTKYSVNSIDPITFSAIRFTAVALLSLPLLVVNIKKFSMLNLKYALLGGLFITIASFGYVWAIYYGQANFVTILMLSSPVLLVFFSAKLTNEKIKRKAIAGVALAATGAFIIIFGPLISNEYSTDSNLWISALFVVADIIAFPLAIVFSKKAYSKGLPIATTLGVGSWVAALFYVTTFIVFVDSSTIDIDNNVLLSTLYTGVGIIFIARMLDIISYKKLGSAVLSTLFYLEMFLGILLATILLTEPLTPTMFIGGVIILLSVWLTESHKHPHFPHMHMLKRH